MSNDFERVCWAFSKNRDFGAESEPLVYEEFCERGDEDSVLLGCQARAYQGDCGSDSGYSAVMDAVHDDCQGRR